VPGLDHGRCEQLPVHCAEPYEDRRESSDVLDVEEPVGRIHQQHLLLLEVGEADREERTLGRRLVTEALQVCPC